MTHPDQAPELDSRLANPDQYFAEKYGAVVVRYGKHELPLSAALQFEHLARSPEDIDNDPKERRANVFIGMLRDTGALDPADDVIYQEPS
jgi:hypothetical protein